jgi:Protein of unknown function, DUF547
MQKLLLHFLLALLSISGAANAAAFDHSHKSFDALLAKHVFWDRAGVATTVDYAALARNRAALDDYTARLSAVTQAEFARWSVAEQRAFLINAYNAFTLQLILTRYPKLKSIRDFGNIVFNSPWKQRFFGLLGAERHLDEVEHEMLRGAPGFDEPRVHFAVNCASIGCPALRPEAFVAARLDGQLDDQTRRFLRDRSRNAIAADGKRLAISPIFKWYAEDFERGYGGVRSVQGFLARYATELAANETDRNRIAAAKMPLTYTDYDWALNARR